MNESPFSKQDFPRLPNLTEAEVEKLSDSIVNSPDIMRRLEMDPAGERARGKLIGDAVERDTEEFYETLAPIDELRKNVLDAYDVRAQNPEDSDDPDF